MSVCSAGRKRYKTRRKDVGNEQACEFLTGRRRRRRRRRTLQPIAAIEIEEQQQRRWRRRRRNGHDGTARYGTEWNGIESNGTEYYLIKTTTTSATERVDSPACPDVLQKNVFVSFTGKSVGHFFQCPPPPHFSLSLFVLAKYICF